MAGSDPKLGRFDYVSMNGQEQARRFEMLEDKINGLIAALMPRIQIAEGKVKDGQMIVDAISKDFDFLKRQVEAVRADIGGPGLADLTERIDVVRSLVITGINIRSDMEKKIKQLELMLSVLIRSIPREAIQKSIAEEQSKIVNSTYQSHLDMDTEDAVYALELLEQIAGRP